MLKRIVNVREGETRPLLWSFAYFFCLLCSYYILRPVRDEMGIQGGVKNLQWAFTGTFVAMLAAVPMFGAVAARLPRHKLLPLVYYFFILNLLGFFALFKSGIATASVAWAFFIWVSVFNLFVVSVFWSLMADLFTNEQARRLFGFIAAGGSAGALLGPTLAASLAIALGPVNLLLISALFLILAVVCIHRLVRRLPEYEHAARSREERAPPEEGQAREAHSQEVSIGGGILTGVKLVFQSPYLLGICLYIWLYTTLSTFLYFEQAHIVVDTFAESKRRTALFASIDLVVNALTVLGQVFLTGRIVARFGVPVTLALVPAAMVLGFLTLGLFPVLPVLVAFQVLQRAGNHAISRPAREILFTVVGREEKYTSKNFIDTVVYRGGDAVSGWLFAGLAGMGLGRSGIAFAAVPVAAAWLITGLGLGKKQEAWRCDPWRIRATCQVPFGRSRSRAGAP
ncbi:MAG: MFS transporter [candidate division NC10 bacterium]|nr:MFS transporter [candidate division NC10 bacterium]